MRKSISCIAAGAAAALVLAACGGTPVGDSGSTPGFDGKTITVGVLNPIAGPVGAAAGKPLLTGLEARIARINANGGIAGKYPIELEVADTEYDPQTAIRAYTGMSGHVVMIGSVLGTGVLQALLPKFTQDKLLAIPATNASAWLHQPNLLPTGPTYEVAFINGMSYLHHEPGGNSKTYCTLRQDDASGEAYNNGITFGAEHLGIDIAADVAFPNTTTDFTAQIQQLKSAKCDVVLYAASASFAQGTISSAIQLDFAPTWLTLGSGVPLFLMGTPAQDYVAAHWLVSTTGAEWGDTSVTGMAELVEDIEKYGDSSGEPDATLWPIGYGYGIAIETLLEKAVADDDLSPAHILEISHSSELTIDFKGLAPSFTYGPPESRKAPTEVSIFAIDPAAPGFLKTLAANVESDAAKQF